MSTVKVNTVDTLKTTIMFCVLLGFGSVISIFNPSAVDIAVLFFVFVLMSVGGGYKLDKKIFITLLLVWGIACLSMFVTKSSWSDYKGIFFRSAIVVFIITAFRNNYTDITRHLIKAIWIVTALAFVNFFLVNLARPLFVLATTSTGYSVNTIGLIFNWNNYSQLMGILFVRNQSIFWEPGVLQISINILLYYILIEKGQSIRKAILPIFVLLTTGSTTGMIIFAFLLLVKFKSSFSFSGKGLLRTIGMLLLILAFLPILFAELHSKFTGEHKNSSTMRNYDLLMGMSVISKYPFAGIGMNQDRYLALTDMKIGDIEVTQERGNTNTFISMMVKFGIPIALVLFYVLFKQQLFKQRFSFFVVMGLSLLSEPLLVVYLVILLMFSATKISFIKKGCYESAISDR